MKRRRKGSLGFTFVEMLIVVMIVGLLAAISTVVVLRQRLQGNESVAMGSLEVYRSAMETYRSLQQVPTYPPTLAALGVGQDIDPLLAQGVKSGYQFTLSNVSEATYTITATPLQPGASGNKTFSVNESGEIIEG